MCIVKETSTDVSASFKQQQNLGKLGKQGILRVSNQIIILANLALPSSPGQKKP